jgi:hypothetical protein
MHWHIPPMRAMMMTTGRFRYLTTIHVGWQTLWPDRAVGFHRPLDHQACVFVVIFDVCIICCVNNILVVFCDNKSASDSVKAEKRDEATNYEIRTPKRIYICKALTASEI